MEINAGYEAFKIFIGFVAFGYLHLVLKNDYEMPWFISITVASILSSAIVFLLSLGLDPFFYDKDSLETITQLTKHLPKGY